MMKVMKIDNCQNNEFWNEIPNDNGELEDIDINFANKNIDINLI